MGLIDRFFSKKSKEVTPIDFGLIHTDIHSHLIPGIDDGSQSMTESIEMLKALISLGYKKVITTPHIMSDMYPNTKEVILAGYDKLKEEIGKQGLSIEVEVASEYFMDAHFEELLARKEILTFGDDMVLFELPFGQEPLNLKKIIFDMQLAGYTPVIAHPERYSYWHKDFKKYQDLFSKDVILQLNINSLSGHYSPEVQRVAEKLIDQGLISLIGTDMHHIGHADLLSTTAKTPYLTKLVESGKLINTEL